MFDLPVVARVKGEGPVQFTKSCTAQELLTKCIAALPVDLVYFVVPHSDGKGYSLREAGLLTLDLQPVEHQTQPAPLEPPSPQTVATYKWEAPTPQETTQFQTYQFDLDNPIKPQPQSVLLKERGLEQPTPKPIKKKRTKKRPEPSDDDLPHPTSQGSTVKVTRISTATKAEQEAAGKNFSGLK